MLDKECEKTGAKFHSMRSWGSRGKEDKQFYEERGLVDSDEDDEKEAVGSSKRKTGDDDLSDLMPWLRENASGEFHHISFFKTCLNSLLKDGNIF